MRRERLRPGPLDEAARVDDDKIGPVRLADQLIAVELQQAEHPLAIDEVFRAAEADEGVGALGIGAAGWSSVRIASTSVRNSRAMARKLIDSTAVRAD